MCKKVLCVSIGSWCFYLTPSESAVGPDTYPHVHLFEYVFDPSRHSSWRLTLLLPNIATDALKQAVNAAIVLERPLLIKGEPGTGKTLLAEELAESLGTQLITWHIKSSTKAAQGLYEYDAVSRLRDSQLGVEGVENVANYIKPGKLWEAFTADERVVLLIDEIDKADIEFPNDLLQELDRMEFHVYETGETIRADQRPIIIITSNNEKELPDAFLRRCFFHYIEFPDRAHSEGDSGCALSGYCTAAGRRSAERIFRTT